MSSQSYRQNQQRKLWDVLDLTNAIDDVRQNRLSLRQAERRYNIPKSTIARYVNGEVTVGTKSGPPPLLTPEEEEALVEWISSLSRMEAAVTRVDVERKINTFFKVRYNEDRWVTSGWWQRFLERHPELSSRYGEGLCSIRSNAFSVDRMTTHFKRLHKYLDPESEEYIPPDRIYNIDETGLERPDKLRTKVLTQRGVKHAWTRAAHGTREHVSIRRSHQLQQR